jgi:hypothetical protein
VKSLYFVSGAALQAVGPIPGALVYDFAGDWHLLIVEQWSDHELQDRLEGFPVSDVIGLQPWDYTKPAPAALVSTFTDSKVASVDATDTIETALWKIRAQCAAARP